MKTLRVTGAAGSDQQSPQGDQSGTSFREGTEAWGRGDILTWVRGSTQAAGFCLTFEYQREGNST